MTLSRSLAWLPLAPGLWCTAVACASDPSGPAIAEHAAPSPAAAAAWSEFGGTRECRLNLDDCEYNRDRCMSDCWSEAVTNPEWDCTGSCDDNWPLSCFRGGSECAIYSYNFNGGELLPDVQMACEAAVARDERCAGSSVAGACDAMATVESQEMTSVYACVAETACADSMEACLPAREGALADEICERVEERCYTYLCDPDWRRAVQVNQAWWREEVVDAARACLDELGCRNTLDCLSAWSSAVFRGTSLQNISEWDFR